MTPRHIATALTNRAKEISLINHLLRYNPLYYGRALRIFRSIQSVDASPPAPISHLLNRSLRWARQTEYGQSFGSDISDWPVLDKADVAAFPERFRRRIPFAVAASTGGTTGRPLKLWRSLECVAAEQAMIDAIVCADQPPFIQRRVAILRADYVKSPADKAPPYGVWRNRRRWLVLSNPHLSAATFPWYLATLSEFKPELLWVYPSALASLLNLLSASKGRLKADTVLSSSEMLSDSLRETATHMLSAAVIDHYGHGERMCSAFSVATKQYWFNRAYGHVELIPLPASPAKNEESRARIICTGYWNSAFPLVRYDTGDIAVLPSSTTRSEIPLIAAGRRPFLGILGRADDYLIGRDGAQIVGMNHLPRELEAVLQIQVIQESVDVVRILVVARNEFTDADRQRLERNARELLPASMRVEFTATDRLETLPNGKTPFIIRRGIRT